MGAKGERSIFTCDRMPKTSSYLWLGVGERERPTFTCVQEAKDRFLPVVGGGGGVGEKDQSIPVTRCQRQVHTCGCKGGG